MKQLKVAYKKLYNSIIGSDWESGFCKPSLEAEYTTFTTMQGKDFQKSQDSNGKTFRFMLIGRAVNGWDEFREDAKEYLTEDRFIDSSIKNIINDKSTLTHGEDRFEWINTNDGKANNTGRTGIDRELVDGKYSLRKAQIWSYSKAIWDGLYGKETKWEERWFEKIVWSNLYKIAPHNGGNPCTKLMKKQEHACCELLKAEIEYFKPTHIFIATAYDGWFDKFEGIFQNVVKCGKNIYSGESKNNVYVETIANYEYEDGSKAKIVVACRPEGREKEGYVKQVCSYFK